MHPTAVTLRAPLEWLPVAARVHLFPAWETLQITAVVVASVWFATRVRGRDRGLRACLLLGFAGAAIGAVLLGTLLRVPAFILSGFHSSPRTGDFMAYGALIGLCVTYATLARSQGFDVDRSLDHLAAPAGVLVAIARVGCFIAGCDYGQPTSLPWGVRYPSDSPAFARHRDAGWLRPEDTTSLPVHPTQLYEAALGVLVIAVAISMERRAVRPGRAFAAAAMTYALGRVFIEMLRGDAERGGFGPLSTAQWLSLSIVAWLALRELSRPGEDQRGARSPRPSPGRRS
jgi:prolipoprotein diacylglyceryltransferase